LVAEFHFVEDYEKLVKRLIAEHPIDKAMEIAVGGGFEAMGNIEVAALMHFGLRDGMSLIDLGCGSGRLAAAASKKLELFYIGTDIVQDLLDYAKTKTPASYQFLLHRHLSLPSPDKSADFVSAFSVFTHLLQPEVFLYLEDAKRVLHSGGRLVFSFLELADKAHWETFRTTVESKRRGTGDHLNTFIERDQIAVWCEHLGFKTPKFIAGTSAPWGGLPLGQSLAVTTKS
jgi:ubiquinone/menaquinone biosynthesis C-methylase UbiE